MGSRYCADGLLLLALFASPLIAQSNPGEPIRPEWCRELPRPQYKKFDRVDVASDWFEVYRITHGVFAIYEPHQFEEVISYRIRNRTDQRRHRQANQIACNRGELAYPP